jgi:5''-nucleotidase, lipoprotein e(P4) family
MKHNLLIITLVFILSSCQPQTTPINEKPQSVDPTLIATIYAQRSAEFDALCYQAYNIATLRLGECLKLKYEKPLAVVVDIDETILDNYPWAGKAIKEGQAFPAFWDEWVSLGVAEPIPGALSFLQYASLNGVKVFYVSNRTVKDMESTMRNLSEKGFPNVKPQFMLFKSAETGSPKESRRQKIMEDYEIVMLCGDNLADFNVMFDSPDELVRDEAAKIFSSEFGNKWIVLPNPVYGNWLNAIMSQKPDSLDANHYLKTVLRGF